MRRWFLSYNSQDLALIQGIEAALRRKDSEAHIFFATKSLRAGGYWLPELAKEIGEATAFVLLVGETGLGPWQVIEYYEALDKRVKVADFPVVLVLLDGQPAPGLPATPGCVRAGFQRARPAYGAIPDFAPLVSFGSAEPRWAADPRGGRARVGSSPLLDDRRGRGRGRSLRKG